jgi:hypothetical protein
MIELPYPSSLKVEASVATALETASAMDIFDALLPARFLAGDGENRRNLARASTNDFFDY